MSAACARVMRFAAKKLKPGQDLTAIDHVIQAVVRVHEIRDALKESGISDPDLIRTAILEIRSKLCLDTSANETFNIRLDQTFALDNIEVVQRNRTRHPVGYEDETREIIQILSRRRKRTPVVAGESCMTRRFIMEVLASMILSSKVPSELERYRVLPVQKGFLEAGLWDLEERCKHISYHMRSLNYPAIL